MAENSTTAKVVDFALASLQQSKQNNAGGKSDINETAAKQAIEMVAETSRQQLAMFKEKVSSDNQAPVQMMQLVTTLVAAMKPPPPPPSDFSMKDMIMLMQENQKQQMESLKMVIESQKVIPPTTSKISELKEMMELAKLMGGGGAEPASMTDRILDAVSSNAPNLLGLITSIMNNKAVQPQQPQVIQQIPVDANGNALAPPTTIAAPTAIPAAGQPQPQPQPMQQPMTPGDQMTLVRMQVTASLKANYPMILNAIAAGTTGDVFAESFITLYGKGTYIAIKELGHATLLQIFKDIPELYTPAVSAVAESGVKQFVNDFVDLEEIIARESMEQESSISTSVNPLEMPKEKVN